ncbi:MAG: dihydrofolate reductase family protein [Actinomycetota bacterium]|nr:dihydrofolate reductase family protein [Actinomycetota bacterium]
MRLLLPEVRDLTPEDLYDLYDVPGPHLRAGFVTSVDGAITVEGRSGGLGSPADKAVFRALRTVCDAVVVGAGTLRNEDYGPVRLQPSGIAWRARHDRSPEIPIVVVSRTGDLGSGRVLEGPTYLALPDALLRSSSGRTSAEERDVEHLPAEPAALVAALHELGLTRLLCEGGPSLLTDLLDAGVLDELCLTVSPMVVGEGPRLVSSLREPVDLELTSLIHEDPGVVLGRWSVVRSRGE